jgi:ketosteroid isomerase-like protein
MSAGPDEQANPSNIEIVRAVYAAMAERDLDLLVELLDPACVITQDPALPWGGRHVGHEGFANFGLSLSGTIDSAVAIDAVFEADGEVIQFGHTRGTVRANGASFDIPEVHRWTIENGRAVAAHFAIDTAAMLDALGR